MTTTSAPLVVPTDMIVQGHLAPNELTVPPASNDDDSIQANAKVAYTKLQHKFPIRFSPRTGRQLFTARSPVINIDNGGGTTIDTTILRHPKAIEIVRARIVYDTETAGTVAGANAKLGTTVGGAEIVAATNYTNSAAVGSTTAMTLVDGTVAAATPVIFRHTGIAATAAGEAHIEIDYYVTDTEIWDVTEIIHTCYGITGGIANVEVICGTAPTGGDKAFTVDVKKGSPSSAFASVLSSVITVNSTSVSLTPDVGTVSDGSLADGDSVQVVVATSGTTGTQASDVVIVVWVWENPLTS